MTRVDPRTGEVLQDPRGVHFEPSDPEDTAPLEPAPLEPDDVGGWDRATLLVVRCVAAVGVAVGVWAIVATPGAVFAVAAAGVAIALVAREKSRRGGGD